MLYAYMSLCLCVGKNLLGQVESSLSLVYNHELTIELCHNTELKVG